MKDYKIMEAENLEKRLETIETKIDKIADLVTQTQIQEFRLSAVERAVKVLEEKVESIDKRAGNTALKWLGLIGGGIMTILLSFIAVKVGLK